MLEAAGCFAAGLLVWCVATLAPEALALVVATLTLAAALLTMYTDTGASQKDEE